jgi:cyanophycin synthetase
MGREMQSLTFLKARAAAARAGVLLQRVSRAARTEKTQRSDFYLKLWSRAADEIGAAVVKSHGDLLTIARGRAEAKVFRNYTDLDGPVTLRAAGMKPLVHELLRARSIPTPAYETFSLNRLHVALDFLRAHTPCVVKPATGTGAGAGVATGITTRRQLINAAIAAAGHGGELLIEQQIAGTNLRLLYLDGKLLDAVERRPPTVVGDGNSTVARLVRSANQDRSERGSLAAQVFLKYDLDVERTLAEQGLSWRAVPESGCVVRVKTVINDNAAVDNVSIVDVVAKEIVEAGRQAAEAVNVRLAGVDVVTPDVTADLISAGGVILEINTTPGLYIHEGKQPLPVAVPILEACLNQSRKTSRPERVSLALFVAGKGN